MPAKPDYSVIIASDLRTGRSVYFTADSQWTNSVTLAEVVAADCAEQRLQVARLGECNNLVVDPYLIGMSDAQSAVDIRERIRIEGPSILEQHPLLAAGSRAA